VSKDFASFGEQARDNSNTPDNPETPAAPVEEDRPRDRAPDPLRGSRTSGFWAGVLVLAVLLLLLAVFILQNTQKVEVSFLGWNGRAPLAATLLLAAVAGSVVVATAGLLRILQLRRRVKRSGNTARS
jgi:uncharacterized integral membrane protein